MANSSTYEVLVGRLSRLSLLSRLSRLSRLLGFGSWQRHQDIRRRPRHTETVADRCLKEVHLSLPWAECGRRVVASQKIRSTLGQRCQTRETRETHAPSQPQWAPASRVVASCGSQGGPSTSACVASVRGHSAVWEPSIRNIEEVPRHSKTFQDIPRRSTWSSKALQSSLQV